MKKLVLLLLGLPLVGCTSANPINPECAYRWVADSCGQYYLTYGYPNPATGQPTAHASTPWIGNSNYSNGPVYSSAGFGNEDWSPGYARGDGR